MEILAVCLVAAVTLGICFLADKGFQKLFRSRTQHRSGLSVRLSKRYGSVGLVLAVLGVAAIFTGRPDNWFLMIGGGVVILLGIAMAIYYLSVGIYYDEESFLYTTLFGRTREYRYGQITGQQLYTNSGGIIVELHLSDGKTVQLHGGMQGVDAFLDKAFAGWCAQTGNDPETCEFHDPENSCWFPRAEE